ncbi:MAG: ABC transporter ATP-binding protein [Hydrogenothermaceae bacterium]|nr:ABC transporter ATP-binding protein [Hydrogenothermaceae bacterium]
MAIEVENLKVEFELSEGKIEAVKGVSFKVNKGEILAIVGESGSGKSVSCMAIMGLLPEYAKISGSIKIDNVNIDREIIKKVRGKKITMVFQEPSAVLNPLLTVGEQIVETILAHNNISRKEAVDIAIKSMEEAKIPQATRRFYQYPHELSGGLKQRVVIAIAIANKPDYILADEPTTALDVTTSAQILKLLTNLKESYKIGIALITHDLGVVAQVADRVIVMYKGQILEEGDVYSIFDNPKSDYTKRLLSSRLNIKSISA